jgi:hypothetical protein
MGHKNYSNYSKQNNVKPEISEENVQNIQEEEITVTEPEIAGTSYDVVEVEETVTETEPDATTITTGTVVNCEKLNIRAEAKADAKILGTFFKGQEVEVDLNTSTDEFYDVIIGFCMKKYIELN